MFQTGDIVQRNGGPLYVVLGQAPQYDLNPTFYHIRLMRNGEPVDWDEKETRLMGYDRVGTYV